MVNAMLDGRRGFSEKITTLGPVRQWTQKWSLIFWTVDFYNVGKYVWAILLYMSYSKLYATHTSKSTDQKKLSMYSVNVKTKLTWILRYQRIACYHAQAVFRVPSNVPYHYIFIGQCRASLHLEDSNALQVSESATLKQALSLTTFQYLNYLRGSHRQVFLDWCTPS